MFRLIDNLAMLSSASRVILMLLMVELSLQTCDDWSPWAPSDCQQGSQQMGSRKCTSTNSRMELYTSKTRLCPGIVPVSGCEIVNVNFGGNDIPGGLSKQENWQSCQSSCKNNQKCSHWTFRNSDENCWIKTGHNVQSRADGLVSGPQDCSVSGCEIVNVNFGGNDIPGGLSKQQNWQSCQSSCKINPTCSHWTFRNSDGNCWFKTGNNVQSREDGLVSGPQDCSGNT